MQLAYVTPHRWTGFFDEARGDEGYDRIVFTASVAGIYGFGGPTTRGESRLSNTIDG